MDSVRGQGVGSPPKNVEDMDEFQDNELEELYSWIDGIPLTRPKRNVARDFSDGVLVAEVVKHSIPKFVELHNYAPANSTQQKIQNWSLLNRKVFSKLNFQLSEDVIRSVSMCKAGVIEKVLLMLRVKISKALWSLQQPKHELMAPPIMNDKPEADQNIAGTGNLTPLRQGLSTTSHGQPVKGSSTVNNVQYKGSHQRMPFNSNEMIPRILLEEKEQENLAKEETIQILQAKIKRLEHLVHLKDVRIDDLQNRMEQLRPTGNGHRR
ncbi:sperm flagellar protein 1 [Patella vulgata]|uniref:sperm flagellar protein 1 n=1 Tax=Patella vulgata TaxID=6465 RepID=UPI00217F2C6A|nr:sperm flagellar protein 1 [Patella vulgata]